MGINNITAMGMYNMCIKKRRYKTLGQAQNKAKKYTKMFGVYQEPYYCPLCGNYHLTTHPQKKRA